MPNTDLSPSEYAHLSRGSNAKVNGAIPWFKAFCVETGHKFEDAIICVTGTGSNAKGDHTTFDAFIQWFGEKAERDEEVVIPPDCTKPHRRRVSHDKLLTCSRWMYNLVNHQLALEGQRGFSVDDKWCPSMPHWKSAVEKLVRRGRDGKFATCARIGTEPFFVARLHGQVIPHVLWTRNRSVAGTRRLNHAATSV